MARVPIRGTIQIWWIEQDYSFAGSSIAPTVADMAAATQLRGTAGGEDAESLSGFDASGSTTATGGLSTLVDTQIGGPTTLGDAEIVYFRDNTSEPIFDFLDEDPVAATGNSGYIYIMPFPSADPPAATDKFTLFTMTTTAKNSDYSGDAPRFRASWAQSTPPIDGAVVA